MWRQADFQISAPSPFIYLDKSLLFLTGRQHPQWPPTGLEKVVTKMKITINLLTVKLQLCQGRVCQCEVFNYVFSHYFISFVWNKVPGVNRKGRDFRSTFIRVTWSGWNSAPLVTNGCPCGQTWYCSVTVRRTESAHASNRWRCCPAVNWPFRLVGVEKETEKHLLDSTETFIRLKKNRLTLN